MASLVDEETIFTIPDGASLSPIVDAVNLREGTFQVLNTGTLGVTTLTTDTIDEATLGEGTTINGLTIGSGTFGLIPYVYMIPTTVDSGLVLSANGTGALTASVPTGTAAGGNARGQYAVDLQRTRGNAINVASGNYSAILTGSDNTASSLHSVVVSGSVNDSSGAGYNFIGAGINNRCSGATVTTCSVLNGILNRVDGATNATQGSTILGGSGCTINNSPNAVILSGSGHTINWPLAIANTSGGMIAGGDTCTVTNAEAYIFGSSGSTVTNTSRVAIICSDTNTVDNSTGAVWASNANVSASTEISIGADTAIVTNCLNSSALFGATVTMTNADNSLAGGENVTTTFANTVVLGDGVTPTASTAANEMTLNYSAGLRLVGNILRISDISEIRTTPAVVTTVGAVAITLISFPKEVPPRYCTVEYTIMGHNAVGDVASISDKAVISTGGVSYISSLDPVIYESPAFAGTVYALTFTVPDVILTVSGHAGETINWSATMIITGSN